MSVAMSAIAFTTTGIEYTCMFRRRVVLKGTYPIGGNQPHQIAGNFRANTAMTKLGTASRITLVIRIEWSVSPFCLTAAHAPNGMAMAAWTSTVRTTSSIVTGNRRLISSEMGV